jgi:hypothetical protein
MSSGASEPSRLLDVMKKSSDPRTLAVRPVICDRDRRLEWQQVGSAGALTKPP